MQVTKGTWRMREQCVPGSLSSSPAQEPGNEASMLPYGNAFGVLHQCVKHRCVALSGFHLEVGATCQYRMHTTYGHSKIHFQAHVNFKRQLFYSFCFIYY